MKKIRKILLSVHALNKSYKGLKALENLSFQVMEGEIFGLLGPNGAGKSTTIECLLGTKKTDSVNVKTANLLCTIFYFPMLFLFGATIPFEIMPRGLQAVSSIMPLTQGIKLLKYVSLEPDGGDWMKPVLILILTALAGIIISIKTFRWE